MNFIPHLRSMTWATRRAVQSSVAKPNERGFLRNQPRTVRAWQAESACKTVVGQRWKGAGMRGGEPGSHAVCHVRALYRSEKSQWSAFWQRCAA